MPDPETDISIESSLNPDADFERRADTDQKLDHEDAPTREGPDEDDAEAAYDPSGVEASRARELGLGMGQRDLQRQAEPAVFDSGADDDELEGPRDDIEGPDDSQVV